MYLMFLIQTNKARVCVFSCLVRHETIKCDVHEEERAHPASSTTPLPCRHTLQGNGVERM